MAASGDRRFSFQTGHKNSFGAIDYVIFAATLAVSAGVGIFYAIKDRKRKNIKDFLLAGGNMHVVPVAMSLIATFMSAITMLGTPAEMYNYTTMYLYIGLGYLLCMAASAHIFVPIFYNLKLTSAYEYLEKRFSRGIRTLGTSLFTVQMIVYMAIVLYAPSLALNAVTGLSLWGSVVAVGICCTFYTTLGGMKAVLWTDTIQVGLMVAGLLAALIQGSIELGGLSRAWRIATEGGRVDFSDFRADPKVRHSFWALTLGGAVIWISNYGTNQAQVQRALTCGSLRHAQIALWINVPGLLIILGLSSLAGIVMYAFYSSCDPQQFGLVSGNDQLFPLFVMDVLGHLPGLPGLFVASIFSGSLSTMSSGLNSLAAVILQDILRPYFLRGMSEERATLCSRVLAVTFGILCLAMTYVASMLGGILQAALALFGMLGCPMLGLFTLGVFFPWANTWGAYAGLFSSLAIMLWIGVGAFTVKVKPALSIRRTHGCNWNLTNLSSLAPVDGLTAFDRNGTLSSQGAGGAISLNMTTSASGLNVSLAEATETSALEELYQLSYLWYGILAVSVVVVVGLTVSFVTGCLDPKEVDPRLVQPVCSVFCPFLPKACLQYLHCGVQHHKRDEWDRREEKQRQRDAKVKVTFLEPEVEMKSFQKEDVIFELETVRLHPVSS